jgi:nitroreductase
VNAAATPGQDRPGSAATYDQAELVLDTIATARSIRRYSFEPVPSADLNRILWVATRAPSGTNRQPFRFLVLRDGPRAQRARSILGDAFRAGWSSKCEREGWTIDRCATDRRQRTLHAMDYFVEHFERIPVIILACYVRYRELHHSEGASIFPACQNLLLASRTLGYGACFSAWHLPVQDALRALLEIPEQVDLSLTITLGRPLGRHGPVRRRPLRELVFEDGWEQTPPWLADPEGSRFTAGGPPRASTVSTEPLQTPSEAPPQTKQHRGEPR